MLASEAASVRIRMNITVPSGCAQWLPAVMNASAVAFIMISRHINTNKMLRLTIKPASPSVNSRAASVRPYCIGIMRSLPSNLVVRFRATQMVGRDQRRQQQHASQLHHQQNGANQENGRSVV